jgi:hypothetical protein
MLVSVAVVAATFTYSLSAPMTAHSNTIRWTMAITDPEVFTRPWTIRSVVPLARRPAITVRDEEDDCNEGNVHLRHLKNTFEKAYGTPVPRSNDLQR